MAWCAAEEYEIRQKGRSLRRESTEGRRWSCMHDQADSLIGDKDQYGPADERFPVGDKSGHEF